MIKVETAHVLFTCLCELLPALIGLLGVKVWAQLEDDDVRVTEAEVDDVM